MEKIKRLIRRFKYIIHLFIGISGAILILAAKSSFSATEGNMVYDVFVGIGCSIVATAVVTLFLLTMLPDDSDEPDELSIWGLQKIYDERRLATFPPNKYPTERLDYIAVGLKHFRSANGDAQQLVRNIKRGLKVRILTLHPNSEFVRKQEKFENAVGLKSDIESLIHWVDHINSRLGAKPKGIIELKFYDGIPLHFYCRADSQIWVGPYLPGIASNNVVTYEFQTNSKGGKMFDDAFQDYWDEKKGIRIVNQNTQYLLGNQGKSIQATLEYFCTEMQKDDGTPIIGVVVLFKEHLNLRRTLFSCNKTDGERYNCYPLNAGAVGKLIELNKTSVRAMFFRDYANDISITYTRQGRNQGVHKIDYSIEPFKKDTDMSAILAAPIYVGNKMIGALTFDFNKPSSKYQNTVNDLIKIENNSPIADDSILHTWFYLADQCARIVTNMLGDEIENNYKDLFEEAWVSNG